MASLIALTPCAGLLPLTIGAITVTEVVPQALTSVAPFKGHKKAVSEALKAKVGAGLPALNRRSGAVTWFGHGVWMVAGAVSVEGAAVTDQSDAWAVVEIKGAGVEDVLARLVPVDLRASVFKKGHVAKTMLAHLSVTVVRTGADSFEITTMRSMSKTLLHDLEVAMRGVAARG
ncbi:sarcosine oxidase subunit gamma [Yoonia litorea]|uniref:Sarcosine oxidase subunit gamma n=1 Tax=Yoonia litorea TaxID=1123755 RepID=A0A1I6LLM8_9RHOB|nr:sarcosine oxidase subunit gamma family protein [Yoonia litorea]SFS04162.1 sarcosine oxidase subunit gamma [Yoonia litorea]